MGQFPFFCPVKWTPQLPLSGRDSGQQKYKIHDKNPPEMTNNFLNTFSTTLTVLKPRPNDRNISEQHIPTLLVQHLQAPAKRSQHLNATYRNIVGRNMLRTFGHPVATCWVLKIELVRMPWRTIVARTWPDDYNIMQHPQMLHEKFDQFQIWANNTQHVATCRNRVAKRAQHAAPNNVVICCVDMFLSFGRGFTRSIKRDYPRQRQL